MPSCLARPIARLFPIRTQVFGCRPPPRYCRISTRYTYRGCEWSATALHRGAEPATRLRLPNTVPRAAGNIIVTVRVSEVEQVFCPSEGTGIAFADLTLASPTFVDVSEQQVATLNRLVDAMIR